MAKDTVNQKNHTILQKDIMRYRTNKFSSNMTLLALAFGCLYFLVLYGQYTYSYEITAGVEPLYYKWTMGLSVVYNLFFLLLACLASIQVKNYQKSSTYVLIALAVVQFARIFWFPLDGFNAIDSLGSRVVSTYSFTFMVVWLCLSTVCFVVAAVFGFIRNGQYYGYKKQLEEGTVDIDAVLKEMDAQEEAEAQATIQDAAVKEELSTEETVAEVPADAGAAKEE